MNTMDILKEQTQALAARRSFAVVTLVNGESTARSSGKMLVYENGESSGTIGGGVLEATARADALKAIKSNTTLCQSYDLTSDASEKGMSCGGKATVMIEPYVSRPVLVMVGAGHVGHAVLKLAGFVGFETVLVDDRDEAEIGDTVALADSFVRVVDFESGLATLDVPETASFVLAAHGHDLDCAALAGALTRKFTYLGMIGSKKKIQALYARLREKGVTEEQLSQVHSPIGLDIGGETPEAIALSIVSEVMMVKNGRSGSSCAEAEK